MRHSAAASDVSSGLSSCCAAAGDPPRLTSRATATAPIARIAPPSRHQTCRAECRSDRSDPDSLSGLLERDQIRAGQRYGVRFHRLVRQVRITRIQYVIETDGGLVVAAG